MTNQPRNSEERKALYVPAADNRRVRRATETRWAPEKLVTRQAVEEFERLAEQALHDARGGRCSPLQYHMYRMRMDPATLAQATGLWRWRVRRHRLSPKAFRRLSDRVVRRYANALNVDLDTLKSLPPEFDS